MKYTFLVRRVLEEELTWHVEAPTYLEAMEQFENLAADGDETADDTNDIVNDWELVEVKDENGETYPLE
jgi:hypothetical protein